MDPGEAEALLDGLPLVPAMAGSIPEMKALRERCLAQGIPALVGSTGSVGKGWGTRTHLLVQEEDLPAIAALLRADFRELAGVDVDLSGDACPACGTKAPLVRGACADCGLQLE